MEKYLSMCVVVNGLYIRFFFFFWLFIHLLIIIILCPVIFKNNPCIARGTSSFYIKEKNDTIIYENC
jgi:hypothetical protein